MITLFDNFEGSSVNLRWSSATASEVLIAPAVQGSEVISDEKRWLRPTVGVRGVVGINPTFAFLNYTGAPTNNSYHGADFVEDLASVKGLNGVVSNVVVPVLVPVPTPAPVVPPAPAPVVVTPPPLPPSTAQVFSGNFTVTINNDGTRTFTGTYR